MTKQSLQQTSVKLACVGILLALTSCSHELEGQGRPCTTPADCLQGQTCGPDNRCVAITVDAGKDSIAPDSAPDLPPVDASVVDGPPLDGPSLDGPTKDGPLPDKPLGDMPLKDGPPKDGPAADAATADLSLADASAPDAPLPDAATPDTSKPDTSAPDASKPDASLPDAAKADAVTPDMTQPDMIPADMNTCATKCDDKKACTTDTCGDSGCKNTLKPGNCLISNTCYAKGVAHSTISCLWCDPDYDVNDWAPAKGCVITLAGTGNSGYKDGAASTAQFKNPAAVATDNKGKVYVADKANDLVRLIYKGQVSTVAGKQGAKYLDQPSGVAVDKWGNVLISDQDHHQIKILMGGLLSVYAGMGHHSYFTDGPLGTATFWNPAALAFDSLGNLYIADKFFHAIRMSNGADISTAVGQGQKPGFVDKVPPKSAKLKYPGGVAVYGSSHIYIADTQNHRIRQVYLGQITTVAGSGTIGYSNGTSALSATFDNPSDVAVDSANTKVYIADHKNSLLRVLSGGKVSTLGTGGGYQDGPIATARFKLIHGLFMSKADYLYIADLGNHRVRVYKP